MNIVTSSILKKSIRTIPDFPKKGIMFRDITSVWKNPFLLKALVTDVKEHYAGLGITKVLGIESRGFVLGAMSANHLDAGFVPVRKPGKLPGETISQSYQKEYGEDTLEISCGSLNSEDTVLIQDDLLATGGTVKAVIDLCHQCGVTKIYVNCTIELTDLKGRESLPSDVKVYCPITFEGE